MRARGTIVGIVGLWLIVAGFAGFIPVIQIWSDLCAGAIATVLGFSIGMTHPLRGFLITISGIGMLIAATIPALLVEPGLLVSNIIAGLVIAGTGFSMPRHTETDVEIRRVA